MAQVAHELRLGAPSMGLQGNTGFYSVRSYKRPFAALCDTVIIQKLAAVKI
jgi:hypothetical protein